MLLVIPYSLLAPPASVRSRLEISQIGRRLVLPGGHQIVVTAAVIGLLADLDQVTERLRRIIRLDHQHARNRADEADRRKIERLLRDPGIVRNKLKIASTIANAQAFLRVQKESGSFDRYIWQFVGGKPRVNSPKSMKQVLARTPESDAMSKDLKKRGFNFVGSTICYAFMQAVGMVNDHVVGCFRYKLLA